VAVEPQPTLPLVTDVQRLAHILGLRLEQALTDRQLSQAEAHVLSLLGPRGQATIAELQAGVRHRTSTLTGIIDRLTDKGLVERRINPADRRSFVIVATDAGIGAVARVRDVMAAIERDLTLAFSADELAIFRKILARLAATDTDASRPGLER
jgi:DNA-binding MarR family transcriptional regulator